MDNFGVSATTSNSVNITRANSTWTTSGGAFAYSPNTTFTITETDSLDSFAGGTVTLTGYMYNIVTLSDTAAFPAVTPINMIIDQPSQNTLAAMPATLPSIGNPTTSAIGFLISSGTTNANKVPSSYLDGTTPYGSTAYDHTQSLTANQNLQLINGYFRTYASAPVYAYANYTSYNSNSSVNYSTISRTSSDYRFVSFAWNIASRSDNKPYKTLTFTLNNPSTLYQNAINGQLYLDSGYTIPLIIYYRFEQQYTSGGGTNYRIPIGSTNLDNPSIPTYTTALINGNEGYNGTTDINSSNYNTDTLTLALGNGPILNGLTGTSQSGANWIITVSVPQTPNMTVSTSPVYIYCRLGVPMASAFSFNYIRATLTI